jgi:hypothetical protein
MTNKESTSVLRHKIGGKRNSVRCCKIDKRKHWVTMNENENRKHWRSLFKKDKVFKGL